LYKDFKRIIAPVDGSKASDRAIDKAINLGKELGLPVVAIYVIDMNAFSGVLTPDQVSTMWKNVLRDEGTKILEKVKKQGLKKQVNIQPVILEGTPDDEIIKEANKDDLVVMGSKGHSTLDRILVGSASEKVLHHSNATVMIVR
jgi:nucleotide-binding universal stress UspA family protein